MLCGERCKCAIVSTSCTALGRNELDSGPGRVQASFLWARVARSLALPRLRKALARARTYIRDVCNVIHTDSGARTWLPPLSSRMDGSLLSNCFDDFLRARYNNVDWLCCIQPASARGNAIATRNFLFCRVDIRAWWPRACLWIMGGLARSRCCCYAESMLLCRGSVFFWRLLLIGKFSGASCCESNKIAGLGIYL